MDQHGKIIFTAIYIHCPGWVHVCHLALLKVQRHPIEFVLSLFSSVMHICTLSAPTLYKYSFNSQEEI